ncbi:MAG: Glycosyltransferase AglJ [Candidatus Methanolliviera sp. GoM_oil]|nr:MAG: Glycosyltransferase AglJ [Candidatus Methanolliviera sp. GoM_oil]
MKICILMPALNEESSIGATINDMKFEKLKERGHDVEIVVVDGNSKDRTREIAKEKGARIIIEKRRGYGRAYRTGFEQCKDCDIIVTGDADGTYPFSTIPELVEMLEGGFDFITTDRFGSQEEGAMSRMHRVGNMVLSMTLRFLYGVDIRDSQSGMWIFRREKLDALNLTSDGMPLSEEIKIEAFSKLKAREVPIHYTKRIGEKKIRSFQDGFACFWFLFKKKLAE